MLLNIALIYFLGLINLCATEDTQLTDISHNITRQGTVSAVGITFATEADKAEAINRGQVDYNKNPFVPNICQLIHSKTEGEFTSATITQIAPNIYLCCKHTAEILLDANNYFQPKGYEGFEFSLQSGGITLCVIKKLEILHHNSKNIDLALIKLEFDEGAIPACNFLPIATAINDGELGNGFVVSCGEIAVANQEEKEIARALSIHKFQKRGENLVSSLSGNLSDERHQKMIQYVSLLVMAQQEGNLSSRAQALSAIKETARTATFNFPTPDLDNTSVRLMSSLADGASGSPLVIKQGGIFKLLGMLIKGGFMPQALAGGRKIAIINKENLANIVHEAVFLDLTAHKSWIDQSIARLR